MAKFLIVLLSFFYLACQQNSSPGAIKLSPGEFESMLQNKPGIQLLDVRTPAEFKGGSIAGAKNLNIYDANFNRQIENLDKTRPVLVYCAKGGRSATAAEQLKRAGFKEVYDLPGGMEAWRDEGKNTVQ